MSCILQLYMEKQVTLQFSSAAKCFTQTAMVLLALMCAVTRLYDNKHHVTDIVAGSLLGLLMGWYMVNIYRKHFPANNNYL